MLVYSRPSYGHHPRIATAVCVFLASSLAAAVGTPELYSGFINSGGAIISTVATDESSIDTPALQPKHESATIQKAVARAIAQKLDEKDKRDGKHPFRLAQLVADEKAAGEKAAQALGSQSRAAGAPKHNKISTLMRHDKSAHVVNQTDHATQRGSSVSERKLEKFNGNRCELLESFSRGPSQCPQGNKHWSDQTLKDFTSTFFSEWQLQQKALPRHCCMGINHMFGLSFLVHTLQPLAIIESGVSAGHQTFLLRTAVGDSVPILSFDPQDPATAYPEDGDFGHWKDKSGATSYFVGSEFKDFAEVDWSALIPDKTVRERTLVVLDDRQSSIERFRTMQKWGFKLAYYVENYPLQVGSSSDGKCGAARRADNSHSGVSWPSGGAYSPNAVCGSPLPKDANRVLKKDKFGAKCTLLTADQHHRMLRYMQYSLKTYFEFPPLFTPCEGAPPGTDSTRSALLGQGSTFASSLRSHGMPEMDLEISGYAHIFPAFIELVGVDDPGDPLGGTPGLARTTKPGVAKTTAVAKAFHWLKSLR